MPEESLPHPYALQLLRMQEDAPVAMSLFDADDRMRWANKAFCSAYGVGPDEEITFADLIRRCHTTGVGALIETDDIESWLVGVSLRRGKVPFRAFEADLCDGRWLWMTETLDANGWLMCIASDISTLRTGQRGLRLQRDSALRAAQIDTLTGISNRAHIMQQLQDHLKLQRLGRKACGLVMMDLDNFKAVNDTYGHHNGDLVLKHFTNLVFGTLRRLDGFGRLGGEEFMLLLPETEPQQMEIIVGRILELLRQSRPLPDHPDFTYTCSAGLLLLRPDLDADTSYKLADSAMYAAKNAGRDQFKWA
jgi:diguanylate cyclase (GGDEF)-like protein